MPRYRRSSTRARSINNRREKREERQGGIVANQNLLAGDAVSQEAAAEAAFSRAQQRMANAQRRRNEAGRAAVNAPSEETAEIMNVENEPAQGLTPQKIVSFYMQYGPPGTAVLSDSQQTMLSSFADGLRKGLYKDPGKAGAAVTNLMNRVRSNAAARSASIQTTDPNTGAGITSGGASQGFSDSNAYGVTGNDGNGDPVISEASDAKPLDINEALKFNSEGKPEGSAMDQFMRDADVINANSAALEESGQLGDAQEAAVRRFRQFGSSQANRYSGSAPGGVSQRRSSRRRNRRSSMGYGSGGRA